MSKIIGNDQNYRVPNKLIHDAHDILHNICSVRSRARFREFVHTLGRVVAKPTHQRVCCRYQAKHSKLTEEICLLSEATTYIFPHRNG